MSVVQGRLCIFGAALLWSLGGAFTKVLTEPTAFGLNDPPLETWPIAGFNVPVQIACYRALFAGLVLVPTLRPVDIRFKPLMLVMACSFTLMNATFISAQALGPASNAILLQNSAPFWMYLAAILWLGDAPDRRGTISLFAGMLGVGIIVAGAWGNLVVVAVGLVSGFCYAGIILCLRLLRELPSNWLTVWNHLIAALALFPIVLMLQPPTWPQFITLVLFGVVQLGVGYFLMARGLQAVSPTEAGAIVLLEPILNPVWTYFVCGETPHPLTYVGGAVILMALAYRYWPGDSRQEAVGRRQETGIRSQESHQGPE
ncbi:MAG: EamA family transporter [Planctomycetes bacterium]|nr:EamA family transporter [Planctomycetota bacterium]